VEELCRRAREADVLSVIDGAHGPGQVSLDLEGLGADFYAGNCHKWLCAPKGAGFLYARPERQEFLEPLVVGWGYRDCGFALRHDWESTRDPAAYLAVPAAIQFVREHRRQAECRELLQEGSRQLEAAGFEVFAPKQPLQMASFRLPARDPEEVERRLFEEFRIEVPVWAWNGQALLRVSIAPYNTPATSIGSQRRSGRCSREKEAGVGACDHCGGHTRMLTVRDFRDRLREAREPPGQEELAGRPSRVTRMTSAERNISFAAISLPCAVVADANSSPR
jgi:Aminotransferase class-V